MPHRIFERLVDDETLSDLWSETQKIPPEEIVAVAPIALERAKDAIVTSEMPLPQRRRTLLVAQLLLHRLVFGLMGLPPHPEAPLNLDTVTTPFL